MIMDVQEYTEGHRFHLVGQRVRSIDFESAGEPTRHGVITRISVESGEGTSSGQDEATYWIQWEGASVPDPHGLYAFTR